MAQKKRTTKVSKGTARGARPAQLTRLQLALMGKGPTEAEARRMYRDSAKTPAKVSKAA